MPRPRAHPHPRLCARREYGSEVLLALLRRYRLAHCVPREVAGARIATWQRSDGLSQVCAGTRSVEA